MNTLYILILENEKNVTKKIGKLGIYELKKGYYFYVGSAKKNYLSRINRHLKNEKKLKWHIDYLTVEFKKKVCLVFKNVEFSECELAQALKKEFSLEEPIKKFGSSDCLCYTHLFYLTS
jgi:Uri superfamily endonuclease